MSNIAQKLNALALQVKALVQQINAGVTIVNDLLSTAVGSALSANQGRVLKETIENLSANDVNAEPSGTVATHNTDVLAHANLLAAIANLENAMGSVIGLDTVAQVIVPAINEVRQQVYDLSGGLANIVIDDSALAGITEKTWSVDKIITELQAYKDSILGGAPSAALDTILELSERLLDDGDAIIAINSGLSNRVRFDAAQSLTSPQMLQARQNIGATAQSDVDALALVDNNFLRKDTAAQGLNATEKSNARTNLGLGSASTASDTDGVTEGALNTYFTESRVRATVLTGISFLSNIAVGATDSVLVALGKLQKQVSEREPTLPAATGATKFLREDRTWQATQTPLANALRELGGGGSNALGTNCMLVNCTEVNLNGTDNVAINCSKIITHANQKELTLTNCISPNLITLPRFPKGSRISVTSAIGYLNTKVTTEFGGVKTANNSLIFADVDGIKLPVVLGQTSTHDLTMSNDEFGGMFSKKRILVSNGGAVATQNDGAELQNNPHTAYFVVTPSVSAGMLNISVALSPGYNSNQSFIRCFVESTYSDIA